MILRLYNVVFLFMMEVKAKLGTGRSFFSMFLFDAVVHATLTFRIVALSSVAEEREEALMSKSKTGGKRFARRHPSGQAAGDVLVRLQKQSAAASAGDPELKKLTGQLPRPTNTVIHQGLINSNQKLWKAHLERIADYLLAGANAWWRKTSAGIEFFDVTGSQGCVGPALQHFRWTTRTEVQAKIASDWKKVQQQPSLIPK